MSRDGLEWWHAMLGRGLQAVFRISLAALAAAVYLDTSSQGGQAAFILFCAMCMVASVVTLLIAGAQWELAAPVSKQANGPRKR